MLTKYLLIAFVVVVLFGGCSKDKTSSDSKDAPLEKVVLMTDWYPQPEHGGFYQAQAKGFYRDVGLDVEIRPGGGIRDIRPLVALGQVDFAIGTSDTTLIGITAGLPLKSLAPFFQHDPQCVMFHPELGVRSLEDLDGKVVMMQISLSQAAYLTKVMGLDMKLIPLDYSIARFAQDKSFAQQCFVTSEPIALAKQGIVPEVIMLSESGFDPYRHLYSSEKYINENPDITRRMVEASIKGWRDYIEGDPTPALDAIKTANPQQDLEMMKLALGAIKEHKLVRGTPKEGELLIGTYSKSRLSAQMKTLKELKLISEDINFEQAFSADVLPDMYLP